MGHLRGFLGGFCRRTFASGEVVRPLAHLCRRETILHGKVPPGAVGGEDDAVLVENGHVGRERIERRVSQTLAFLQCSRALFHHPRQFLVEPRKLLLHPLALSDVRPNGHILERSAVIAQERNDGGFQPE